MQVLFEGDAHVHYGFLWFDAVGGSAYETDLMEARAGQTNGLLGAVEPGVLSMVTGMHTGLVALRVELLDAAPPSPGEWDDVVEASVDVRDPEIGLSAFEWGASLSLPAPGCYRARWSDSGADAARETERYDHDEPVVERCLLQLWSAPPAPDAILRETSSYASSWHREARAAAAPPTPEDRARAEERARVEREAQEQQWRRDAELERWGGRDPSPRLLEVEREAVSLTREHRDLVDALASLPVDRQRALARELAHRACAAAVDAPVDWAPALAALDRADPLPPPFHSRSAAYAAAFPRVEATVTYAVGVFAADADRPPRTPLHPASTAVGAVIRAGLADPLAAVLATVEAASWSAPDLDRYFDGIYRRIR